MDKKLRNDIAMFLLGAGSIPQGVPGHTRAAAMATHRLKTALDNPQSHRDLADRVRDRQTAADVYTTKTKARWPF